MATEIYEATQNIHVPSMRCSFARGTRITVFDGARMEALGKSSPLSPDFNVLVRHGYIRKLDEEEAAKPETIEVQKVRHFAPRSKMTVEVKEDYERKISEIRSVDESIVAEDNGVPAEGEAEEGKTLRGMKVVESITHEFDTVPLNTVKTAKKEISPERQAELDRMKAERIKSAQEAEKALSEGGGNDDAASCTETQAEENGQKAPNEKPKASKKPAKKKQVSSPQKKTEVKKDLPKELPVSKDAAEPKPEDNGDSPAGTEKDDASQEKQNAGEI